MRKGIVNLIAIVVATLLVYIVYLALKSIDPAGSIAQRIGIAVAVVTFYLVAFRLAKRFNDRLAASKDAAQVPTKGRSFLLYVALIVVVILFSLGGVTNLLRILSGDFLPIDVPVWYVFVFDVFIPFFSVGLLLLLDFKVRTVRMLDLQKRYVKEMSSSLNGWSLPEPALPYFEPAGPIDITGEVAESYECLLQSICRYSLLAASITGQQERPNLRGMTAVFFLADAKDGECRSFIPVPAAIAGGTPEYKAVLQELRLPALNAKAFFEIYNAYHRRVQDERPDKRRLKAILNDFRAATSNVVSTTGLVFAVERRLVFDDVVGKCITFRFEPFERLPANQRSLFDIQHLVGIPINIFGRKIGVLLFLADYPKAFYQRDKIYWIIGNVFGSAIKLGVTLGYFRSKGMGNILSNAPVLTASDDARATIIEQVKAMKSDFRTPV
jgi:hypothetical protein